MNQIGNPMVTSNTTQNLGSRFQALEEINLNINIDSGMDDDMPRDSRDNNPPKETNLNLEKNL